MLTKSLTIETMDDAGKGLARLATLSAIDRDGDTYAPGAFSWKDGGSQWAPLLTQHWRGMVPFGKARVFEDGDAAFAELHLNLDTAAGKDWHAALKFDLATGKPVQEWSYGYETLDAEYQLKQGQRVRVLKQLDVEEVSGVVRGAGRDTRTLAMKGRNGQLKEAGFDELVGSLGELAGAIGTDPSILSATGRKQLAEIHEALGKSLAIPLEIPAEERAAVDAATAEYLMGMSRRYLAG